jgi:hypothetical protein
VALVERSLAGDPRAMEALIALSALLGLVGEDA